MGSGKCTFFSTGLAWGPYTSFCQMEIFSTDDRHSFLVFFETLDPCLSSEA
jgi:hypothetical protein